MYNRDSPPPSWYEPPDEEEEDEEMPSPLRLVCMECEHVWTAEPGQQIDATSEVECPECGSEDVELYV